MFERLQRAGYPVTVLNIQVGISRKLGLFEHIAQCPFVQFLNLNVVTQSLVSVQNIHVRDQDSCMWFMTSV